jgi:hypothetical protein
MAAFRSTITTLALSLLTGAALSACGGDGPVAPRVPAAAAVVGGATTGSAVVGVAVGEPLRIKVTDAGGRPIKGVAVTWSASGGGSVVALAPTTDGAGVAEASWTLGTAAGPQQASASVAGLASIAFARTALPGAPAAVRLSGDSTFAPMVGDSLRATVQVLDQYGNVIPAPQLQWATSDAGVASVSATGTVSALRGGTAVVTVTSGAARMSFTVNVRAPVVSITAVSVDTLRPGATVAIDGTGFTAGARVSIADVSAIVASVSPTRITVAVPSRYALPCRADGPAPVTVTLLSAESATRAVPIVVATKRSLAVGESVVLSDLETVRCTELPASGGRYVISVMNTSSAPNAISSFQLRGFAAGPPSAGLFADVVSGSRSISAAPRTPARFSAAVRAAQESDARHAEWLDRQREIVERYGSPVAALRAARAQEKGIGRSSSVGAADGTGGAKLGDTLTMQVVNAFGGTCSRASQVRARVTYVGTRSIVLEDVRAARAGTMDDQYALIGKEFDEVQFPIIQKNFGNPLALDAQLDNDGRIAMLFTRMINDSMPGILGYVISCDQYPKTQFAGSNQAEVFYAKVADSLQTPAAWRRGIRSTIIHEVKHITAFAEKAVRCGVGTCFEDSWLEESGARLAEELYSRTFSKETWKSNAGYAGSLGCELTLPCDDRPLMMWKHFSTLADFYANVESLTPLRGQNDTRSTFYASGWSLLRWAADHYATDEAEFLKAVTSATRPRCWPTGAWPWRSTTARTSRRAAASSACRAGTPATRSAA